MTTHDLAKLLLQHPSTEIGVSSVDDMAEIMIYEPQQLVDDILEASMK